MIKLEAELHHQIGYKNCDALRDMITTPVQRGLELEEKIKHFKCIIPKVVARPALYCPSKIDTRNVKEKAYERFAY